MVSVTRSVDGQREIDFTQDVVVVISGCGESHVVGKSEWCGNVKLFEYLFVDAAEVGSGVVKHVDIYAQSCS